MSLKEKALRGFIWTSIENFGSFGVSFIVQIIMARLIAPEEYGLLGLIVIFNAIGVTITDSGISQSIIRLDSPKDNDYLILFLFNSLISVFVYIIIFFLAPFIGEFFELPELVPLVRVYALIIPILALQIVQRTRLTKELKFKTQAIIQIPSIIISSALGIFLAYKNYGVWALVWMQVAQALLLTSQYWIYAKYIPRGKIIKKEVRFHINFGYKLLFSGLLLTIYSNIFPAVIAKFNNPTQVGYYNRASTFKQVPVSIIASIFGKVSYPILAKIQNDETNLVRTYRRLLKSMLLILTPIMCLLFINAEPMIKLLITEKWLPMSPYFKWLCMSGILFPLHSFYLNSIKIKGRSDLYLKTEIIKRIIGVIILAISAPMGMMAIIYGILISNLISLFINQYFCRLVINYTIKTQFKDSLKIIFPTLALMIVFSYYSHFLSTRFNEFLEILISTILFTIFYLGIQYLINKKEIMEFTALLTLLRR